MVDPLFSGRKSFAQETYSSPHAVVERATLARFLLQSAAEGPLSNPGDCRHRQEIFGPRRTACKGALFPEAIKP